jgi:hypothetical protein
MAIPFGYPREVNLRNGCDGLVFWNSEEGKWPLIGCYYVKNALFTGWVPCAWTKNGFRDDEEEMKQHCDIVKWRPVKQREKE